MCVLVVVGVLCENCIVDASIKHVGHAALCVWCVVCVCVISFFFVFIFCQVHLFGHCVHFLCVVVCVFVIKGAWWMPWHAEPMKDVKGCVKPRGVVN